MLYECPIAKAPLAITATWDGRLTCAAYVHRGGMPQQLNSILRIILAIRKYSDYRGTKLVLTEKYFQDLRTRGH